MLEPHKGLLGRWDWLSAAISYRLGQGKESTARPNAAAGAGTSPSQWPSAATSSDQAFSGKRKSRIERDRQEHKANTWNIAGPSPRQLPRP